MEVVVNKVSKKETGLNPYCNGRYSWSLNKYSSTKNN